MTKQEQPKLIKVVHMSNQPKYEIESDDLGWIEKTIREQGGYFNSEIISRMADKIRSRPTPSPAAPEYDCTKCKKHTDGYCLGKDEVRLCQCNTCIFDGKRECVYHGYPDDTIPQSCEYKIGKFAVIAPIEAQMHNKQHDATIRNQTLDDAKKYLEAQYLFFDKERWEQIWQSLRHQSTDSEATDR